MRLIIIASMSVRDIELKPYIYNDLNYKSYILLFDISCVSCTIRVKGKRCENKSIELCNLFESEYLF
jgi:hypothetical protein